MFFMVVQALLNPWKLFVESAVGATGYALYSFDNAGGFRGPYDTS